MSSHHIIREDQEPALVVDDAGNANAESIQQLLEWSPTVMVTAPALNTVLHWGIKIDVVIAPAAQVDALKITLQDQLPLKILSCTAESESVETALYFLMASKQKTVTVVSALNLEFFERFSALEIAVIREGRRWVFIPNGHFEKWLPAGTIVTRYPGNEPESVEKDGMFTTTRNHSFWINEIN